MPFQYNLSQIFEAIMAKTMWDFKFNNMNQLGGFNGGFMNSCWGNGFQMPMWGDTCQFSTVGGGVSNTTGTAKTPEEIVDEKIVNKKHAVMYSILDDYIKTLEQDDKKTMLLAEKIKQFKTPNKTNYEELKALYDENKTEIDKYVAKENDGKIVISKTSQKQVAQIRNSTATDFSTWIENDSLLPRIKVLEVLEGLDGFKAFYEKAISGKDSTGVANLKKFTKAFFNSLKKEAQEIKDNPALKSEIKTKLGDFLDKETDSIKPKDVDEFFAAIKDAKKSIAEKRKEILAEKLETDTGSE